jgi:hypothetical protein
MKEEIIHFIRKRARTVRPLQPPRVTVDERLENVKYKLYGHMPILPTE